MARTDDAGPRLPGVSDPLFLPAGEGPLGRAYGAVDWAATPLGPVAGWSPTLRRTVDLMLRTRFPVTLLWGPELVLVYNEAYVELIGEKHPAALGSRTEDVFPEAWSVIGPLLATARDRAEPIWIDNSPLPLVRHGYLEECHFTFSYSPVLNADGEVEGVMDIAVETTRPVVTQRRLGLLAHLGEVLAEAESVTAVHVAALRVLRSSPTDVAAAVLRPVLRGGLDDERVPAPLASLRREVVVEHHDDGPVCWVPLSSAPATEEGAPPDAPVLGVVPNPMLPLDEDHLAFWRLVGTAIGSALDRVEAMARERRTMEAERALSTTLQRSLLSAPVRTPEVDVVVRYQPAVDIAQVGGDWHDSFLLAEGTLALAVGDVAGHDSQAAAAMAQIRNLLRGIALAAPGSPAAVLGTLDRALEGLGVVEVATAVFAGLRPAPGGHLLSWSNAGHPPPVLLVPGTAARLLHPGEPDPLLGVVPETRRTDHELLIPPGSCLLLFTDGLVERRGVDLDAGLGWLTAWLTDWCAEAVRDGAPHSPEALADALLAVVEPSAEDDIALVVVSTAPAA